MQPAGYLPWIGDIFDQALQDAASLEEPQLGLEEGLYPDSPHAAASGGSLVPEAQHETPAIEDIDHEVEQGVQRFEQKFPTAAVAQARAQAKMTSEGNTACPPATVACKRPRLHGKLIANWPHQCTAGYTMLPSGRYSYVKTITCGAEKCSMSFKKARGFDRHYRTVHIRAAGRTKLDCTFEGCDRVGEFGGFSRRDNLIQHLRSVHHEAIPKSRFRFSGYYSGPAENAVEEERVNMED